MPKILLSGYIQFPQNTSDEDLACIRAELAIHSQLTLNEVGCIRFKVAQNIIDPLRFDMEETFIDKAAFESHQQRVKHSNWCKVSQSASRHYSTSEI
ncbi:putative quinol monooxygenase [Shewanella sp. KT0246]|uniref:putative quinol monooxygenase n=1 Tax=Shewanella sp. KT0246 TaxID=2815912 RepID=UPI001BC7B881|nr:antibiotic biosynthesis monooxygenase [Shewanella sp. KT0246]GIU52720.1 hypothetical protein TUM4249_24130 [Shewanella sp. KT0246]